MTAKFLIASEVGISIKSTTDVVDAVGATFGSAGLLLTDADLSPAFFELRSGLAGELFQKFINYQLRLALVVPQLQARGDRFIELAREHETHGSIRIFESRAKAEEWMFGGG